MWMYYYNNLRKSISKWQFGGWSVLTRWCFSYNGVDSIVFVSGKINSQAYQRVLESHLLLDTDFLMKENWKFLKENWPANISKRTKHWFLVTMFKLWNGQLSSTSQPNRELGRWLSWNRSCNWETFYIIKKVEKLLPKMNCIKQTS